MPAITVLWTEASDIDVDVVRASATECGAICLQVTRRGLPTALMAALARGGVVFIAESDEQASEVLGLGVDEVIRNSQANAPALERAIDRTRMRAGARSRREQAAQRDYVGITLSLLAGTLGHQLNNPLAVASLNCHSVQAGVDEIFALQDNLSGMVAAGGSEPETARMSAAISLAPSAGELRGMIGDAQAALERAATVMKVLRRLSSEEARLGVVRVRSALEDFAALFRPEIEALADLSVDVEESCEVATSRPAFVSLLTILFAYVYDCVRGLSPSPRIALSVSQHDDALLIEVQHNGDSAAAEICLSRGAGYFDNGHTPTDGIALLQDRAQQLGGELLATVDDESSTLRLILPLAAEQPQSPAGIQSEPRISTSLRASRHSVS